MDIKKVFFIGDTHMTGAGAEWPKLFGHLGPVPNKFRANLWSNTIRQNYPNLEKLYVEFYTELGDKIQKHHNEKIELRDKFSFASIIADRLQSDFELLGYGVNDISEVLPYFMSRLNEDSLKDCLVVMGVPKITSSLYFNQKQGDTKLSNKTLPLFASQIFLVKEYVENRGGKFLYFHTEDYPQELYTQEHNPYFIDLLPFRMFEGNLDSLLGLDSYWRKFDGKHYDAGTQKLLGDILYKIVANML